MELDESLVDYELVLDGGDADVAREAIEEARGEARAIIEEWNEALRSRRAPVGPCTFALEATLHAHPGETALLSLLVGITAETVAARSIDTDEELLAISTEMTAIMASLGLEEDDVFLREEWTPRYIELDDAWSRRFDGMGRDVIEQTSPVMTRLLVAPDFEKSREAGRRALFGPVEALDADTRELQRLVLEEHREDGVGRWHPSHPAGPSRPD